jgi:hypothetical protein
MRPFGARFPVFFPVNREFAAETGSPRTATTTTHSDVRGNFPAIRHLPPNWRTCWRQLRLCRRLCEFFGDVLSPLSPRTKFGFPETEIPVRRDVVRMHVCCSAHSGLKQDIARCRLEDGVRKKSFGVCYWPLRNSRRLKVMSEIER